jgi:hypothetical protein
MKQCKVGMLILPSGAAGDYLTTTPEVVKCFYEITYLISSNCNETCLFEVMVVKIKCAT